MERWNTVCYESFFVFVEQEVGMPADFVNKLARMFQDIKVSEDLNGEFKDQHRNNNEGIAGVCAFVNPSLSLSIIENVAVFFRSPGVVNLSFSMSMGMCASVCKCRYVCCWSHCCSLRVYILLPVWICLFSLQNSVVPAHCACFTDFAKAD